MVENIQVVDELYQRWITLGVQIGQEPKQTVFGKTVVERDIASEPVFQIDEMKRLRSPLLLRQAGFTPLATSAPARRDLASAASR
ncbi:MULTISPECIES: hypothetical protein [Lonsdalea]|uniref:Uncharacterized protein n=2 Tax=Lonsdalea TaxID=1082702 RepID=A0ACD1JD54_9GAMM|nr:MULTISPECIES: hypothetical protein [Lonsdalea]OSM95005.1 hypothetical protein AU508_12300 [Lonsdalea populi]OSN01956.1 hypothetical protein AU499_03420 [Lonsdalea populi]QPQ25334.1 hypothetical protein I6N93_06030 [Lonsdalea populi]RAT13952.1 hypothetical protein AU485_07420 [Lonsdalea quercina]RAT21921.1 hypothetical protein AU489_13765 [Lonsdalea populi]